MFKSLGVPELLIILAIVFIIFGAGKLPQIFGAAGQAVRNFRDSQKTELEEGEKPVRRVKKTTRKTAEGE